VADTAGVYGEPIAKGAANTNVLIETPSLTDYGPLQPIRYFEAFRFAPWGAPEDARRLLRQTDWMRACNVGWVLLTSAEFDPPAGCRLVTVTSEGFRLYRYPAPAGEAWIEHAGGQVEVQRVSNHEIRTSVVLDRQPEAGATPRLTLSRLALPGWSARQPDGDPLQIDVAHGALMAAPLTFNQSTVDQTVVIWEYQTPWLRAGAAVSIAALVGLAGTVLVTTAVRRRG
jgi:hypothetical protein